METIRAARQAVLAEPADGSRWGKLGEVLYAHHLVEDAVVCFRRAHRLDPDEFRWPYLASIAMIDAGAEERLQMLRAAQALRPDYGPVNIRLGNALLAGDRPEQARVYFQLASELGPEDSHALLGLARVALALGDVDAARADLEAAANARPRHREVHAALARVYRELGLEEQARESAERASRYPGATSFDDPVRDSVDQLGSSAVHLAARGRRLLEQGRIDEAIELLSLAHRERPDYFDVRVDLGSALVLGGDEREGARLLREAEADAPDLLDADELIDELRARRGP